MFGSQISHIGATVPLVVAPLPVWSFRQGRTVEGGSPQSALLPLPLVLGNLLIGIGFYRRDADFLPPVSWSEGSGHPWTLIASRITNEGSPQFERGIFLYALKVTTGNERVIRFTTGHDCDPEDDLGEDCDILRASLFELIPPVGHTFEDVSFLPVDQRVSGDNGATINGRQVSSDSWAIPAPIGDQYLIVSACGWRTEPGAEMDGLVWTPDLSKGGIFTAGGEHGLALHMGVHPGDDTIVLQGDFDEGQNSGLSMAAVAIEFG